MKKILIILAFFWSLNSNAQSEFSIISKDIQFQVEDIIYVDASYPQLTNTSKNEVIDYINRSIKSEFDSLCGCTDSTSYLNLKESANDEQYSTGYDAKYKIEYISGDLLNISLSLETMPYMSRPLFDYKSLIYDLKTGKKLNFEDIFNIQKTDFLELIKTNGYEVLQLDTGDSISPLTKEMTYCIDDAIESLFDSDNELECTYIYFKKDENYLHLMLKAICCGPSFFDYGIPISYLNKENKYSR